MRKNLRKRKNRHYQPREKKSKKIFTSVNKNFCAKKDGKCHAFDLKEYSVCHNILKSHCGKQACRNAAGEKPKMLLVDAALKHPKQVVRYDDTTDDEMSCVEESDDDVKISDEDTETDSLLTQKLYKVWKSLSPPNHEKTLFRNWYE